MLKVNNDSFQLSDVKNDLNTDLNSDKEREDFIVEFYRTLYKQPVPPPWATVTVWKDFWDWKFVLTLW